MSVIIENPITLRAKKVSGKKSKSRGIKDTLILRPAEFKGILATCDRKHQIILSCLLFTGMRYQELLRFRQHPEWFDGKQFIHLPAGTGQRKVKRAAPERWIRLSYRGREAIQSLFDVQLPSNQSINQYLKYNFHVSHFSMKSLRKTYESWLAFYYENRERLIAQSQGHNTWIQFEHYLNLPFTDEDKMQMREFLEGWV